MCIRDSNYADRDTRLPGGSRIFAALPKLKSSAKVSAGIVRSGDGDEDLALDFVQGNSLYRMLPGADGRLVLSKSNDAKKLAEVKKDFAIDPSAGLGDSYDEASAVITDDDGRRWRFPYAGVRSRGKARLCRECCTERDLLNLCGTFYELPAENAGGYAKARPVATHMREISDYCTWRGLFVISGVDLAAAEGEHVVKSDDGKAALWVGVADDLWKLGLPGGVGGPWKDTSVKAGEPSDPYIMTGFNRKTVHIESDRAAKVTLELDITGCGTWVPYKTYSVVPGEAASDSLTQVRAYWVRAVADVDCRATVQFLYR